MVRCDVLSDVHPSPPTAAAPGGVECSISARGGDLNITSFVRDVVARDSWFRRENGSLRDI